MNDKNESVRDRQTAEFVRNLARLDDGERARLKRNAGKSLAESHQVRLLFYQKVLPYGAPVWDEERYFLLATLYPLDKQQRQRDRDASERSLPASLGASFRSIRRKDNESGLDRRFARLLDANEDQLPFLLRQAIFRLVNENAPIDWQRLSTDILAWNHPDRYVQKKWARDYVAYERDSAEPQTT